MSCNWVLQLMNKATGKKFNVSCSRSAAAIWYALGISIIWVLSSLSLYYILLTQYQSSPMMQARAELLEFESKISRRKWWPCCGTGTTPSCDQNYIRHRDPANTTLMKDVMEFWSKIQSFRGFLVVIVSKGLVVFLCLRLDWLLITGLIYVPCDKWYCCLKPARTFPLLSETAAVAILHP